MPTTSPTIDATLSISAPLLTSEGPVSVSITPDRLELKRPARLVIKPDRDAVNRLLASGQQPGAKPNMQLRELESVAVSLSVAPSTVAPPSAARTIMLASAREVDCSGTKQAMTARATA